MKSVYYQCIQHNDFKCANLNKKYCILNETSPRFFILNENNGEWIMAIERYLSIYYSHSANIKVPKVYILNEINVVWIMVIERYLEI